MPYIIPDSRAKVDEKIVEIANILKSDGVNAGDINYVVTRMIAIAFDISNSCNYNKINTIMGVLECIKQEFYSRIAVPYEAQKATINGDVKEYEEFQKHIYKS